MTSSRSVPFIQPPGNKLGHRANSHPLRQPFETVEMILGSRKLTHTQCSSSFLFSRPPPLPPLLPWQKAKIYRGNRLVWKLVLDDRRELYFGGEILISYKLNSEFNNSSLLRKILRDKMRKYSLWILIRRIIG